MADENIALLAVYLLLIFGDGIAANMISRKEGAKVPSFLSAGGWRSVAGELRRNLLFLALGLIDIALMVMGAVTLYNGAYSLPFAVLGLLVIVASMPILFLARRDLARFWKVSVKPGKAQRLVTTGIYSKIRHPINVSFFVLTLGMALVAGDACAFFLFVLNSIGLFQRSMQEESELVDRFGKEYRDYARRVPAFIPKI